ncbi:hypothetical protein F3J16_25395 [Burkholderia sp. Ap-962]|uniref:hypothetical protein n=1 Tax=Burkholderia sp. Ap-962 TaxID=2608333 RepID=UPI0014216E3B|nr:hypothetical protein [Burkholderia sp. Ap-962]NIF73492.1 hypothetical protein [Burkholderia sp. Ap-962]
MNKNIFYGNFSNVDSFGANHVLSDAEISMVGGAGAGGDAVSTIANGVAIGAGLASAFGPEAIPVGAVIGAGVGAVVAYMDSSQVKS